MDGAVGILGETDEGLGHAEKCGADFLSIEFAMLEKLQVGARKGWFYDVRSSPQKQGTIGSARAALAFVQSCFDLLALFFGELLIGTDNNPGVGIVEH